MGPRALSQDMEACRMSNEALPAEEVAARVRAAVSSDFQPDSVNSFPMRTDEGYFDLASPSSYALSSLVFSSLVSRPCSLKLGSFLTWGDRRKVLVTPSVRR